MESEDKMHTHVHGGRIGWDSENETACRLCLQTAPRVSDPHTLCG